MRCGRGATASGLDKETFRKKAAPTGELDDKEIEIPRSSPAGGGLPLFGIPGMRVDQMGSDLDSAIFSASSAAGPTQDTGASRVKGNPTEILIHANRQEARTKDQLVKESIRGRSRTTHRVSRRRRTRIARDDGRIGGGPCSTRWGVWQGAEPAAADRRGHHGIDHATVL